MLILSVLRRVRFLKCIIYYNIIIPFPNQLTIEAQTLFGYNHLNVWSIFYIIMPCPNQLTIETLILFGYNHLNVWSIFYIIMPCPNQLTIETLILFGYNHLNVWSIFYIIMPCPNQLTIETLILFGYNHFSTLYLDVDMKFYFHACLRQILIILFNSLRSFVSGHFHYFLA